MYAYINVCIHFCMCDLEFAPKDLRSPQALFESLRRVCSFEEGAPKVVFLLWRRAPLLRKGGSFLRCGARKASHCNVEQEMLRARIGRNPCFFEARQASQNTSCDDLAFRGQKFKIKYVYRSPEMLARAALRGPSSKDHNLRSAKHFLLRTAGASVLW